MYLKQRVIEMFADYLVKISMRILTFHILRGRTILISCIINYLSSQQEWKSVIIQRDLYLKKLISYMWDGQVKVITGIRRCGKSYLLRILFKNYLLTHGVKEEHILSFELDLAKDIRYRHPLELAKAVRERVENESDRYYLFVDEIQMSDEVPNPYNPNGKAITFCDALNDLKSLSNLDIYVTGSNSKMLSSDILTQFRDRGDEIRVFPLSYAEFYSVYGEDKRHAWRDYYTYGGMPVVVTLSSHEEKSKYLQDLYTKTYLRDVVERHMIQNDVEVLEDLLNIVSSSIGSLTNPTKLANTFASERQISISGATIERYLGYFIDAFLLHKSQRYDVKGKKYRKTPMKYYFADVGLRNARLGFRQQEENHIMENVIYNDLRRRGFDVDVGVVEYNCKDDEGKKIRKQLEVDFVVNRGSQRYYIQSALTVGDPEKRKQETESLRRIPDSFKKIVVVRDDIIPWHDDNGILFIGVEQFLLEEKGIDL